MKTRAEIVLLTQQNAEEAAKNYEAQVRVRVDKAIHETVNAGRFFVNIRLETSDLLKVSDTAVAKILRADGVVDKVKQSLITDHGFLETDFTVLEEQGDYHLQISWRP